MVTVIGWPFVVFGSAGAVATFVGLTGNHAPTSKMDLMILTIRIVAIVGGAFLLLGCNWARWLLIAWMAYHVVIGALNGPFQFLVHAAFLVGLCFALFRPAVSAWFLSPTS
jgi:hypothetical protein